MKNKQIGFTLIEVMISLALGLLIIGGAFSYFLSTLTTSKSMLSQSKLQQDIRSTATLMQRDLRRAGYSPAGHASELTVKSIWLGKTNSLATNNNCIIYRYIDGNGTLRNSGFLVGSDKKIYMKTAGATNSCTNDTDWTKITAAQNVEITEFTVEYFPGNRPSIIIKLNSRLSNDTTTALPLDLVIVLQNSPTQAIATTGS